jgi:hypothetical protein
MSGPNGNGNNNGQRPPLSFKPVNDIPIIGQPFTIKGWFPTVLLTCNCAKPEAVMIPRGGAAACPSCGRIYSIQVVQGNVQFGIGVMTPELEGVVDTGTNGSGAKS